MKGDRLLRKEGRSFFFGRFSLDKFWERGAVEQNMREAVEFHLDGLKLEGLELPQPTTSSAYIEIAA